MNKTLVIHPFDPSTDFLSIIYEDHSDWTVIRQKLSSDSLREMMAEHDRIILMGHGLPMGLMGFGKIYVDVSYVDILKEKDCVCIWCNADQFVLKYGLRGIYSGMIISEIDEALDHSIIPQHEEEVDLSNTMFAKAVKKIINETTNPISKFRKLYNADSEIVRFNRERMYCIL